VVERPAPHAAPTDAMIQSPPHPGNIAPLIALHCQKHGPQGYLAAYLRASPATPKGHDVPALLQFENAAPLRFSVVVGDGGLAGAGEKALWVAIFDALAKAPSTLIQVGGERAVLDTSQFTEISDRFLQACSEMMPPAAK